MGLLSFFRSSPTPSDGEVSRKIERNRTNSISAHSKVANDAIRKVLNKTFYSADEDFNNKLKLDAIQKIIKDGKRWCQTYCGTLILDDDNRIAIQKLKQAVAQKATQKDD